MSTENLSDKELENLSGGQLGLENVMGVEGLNMCTGAPTNKNPEGVFWKYHGISLTKNEALNLLKKKSTEYLDERYTAEAFLATYIQKYNDEVDGEII